MTAERRISLFQFFATPGIWWIALCAMLFRVNFSWNTAIHERVFECNSTAEAEDLAEWLNNSFPGTDIEGRISDFQKARKENHE